MNSLVDIVKRFSLDGVDLDIESYKDPPQAFVTAIKKLKTALNAAIGTNLVIISPQCVTVYQGVKRIPTLLGSNPEFWNYMVNVIDEADEYVDYYQVQAYNDWYGQPSGSLKYLQSVYLNWRNLPDINAGGSILTNSIVSASKNSRFRGKNGDGVPANKLVMGLLASTVAGVSGHYASPDIVNQFKAWIKANNY